MRWAKTHISQKEFMEVNEASKFLRNMISEYAKVPIELLTDDEKKRIIWLGKQELALERDLAIRRGYNKMETAGIPEDKEIAFGVLHEKGQPDKKVEVAMVTSEGVVKTFDAETGKLIHRGMPTNGKGKIGVELFKNNFLLIGGVAAAGLVLFMMTRKKGKKK